MRAVAGRCGLRAGGGRAGYLARTLTHATPATATAATTAAPAAALATLAVLSTFGADIATRKRRIRGCPLGARAVVLSAAAARARRPLTAGALGKPIPAAAALVVAAAITVAQVAAIATAAAIPVTVAPVSAALAAVAASALCMAPATVVAAAVTAVLVATAGTSGRGGARGRLRLGSAGRLAEENALDARPEARVRRRAVAGDCALALARGRRCRCRGCDGGRCRG